LTNDKLNIIILLKFRHLEMHCHLRRPVTQSGNACLNQWCFNKFSRPVFLREEGAGRLGQFCRP